MTNRESEDTSNSNNGIGMENYDLYPERRGQKAPRSWFNKIFPIDRKKRDRFKCEGNVYHCIQNSELIKLMMAALKNAGCEIDIRRHISCEVCDESVTGGYDAELNQIVVCQNTARSKQIVLGVMAHEMIHMFDFCRNNMDFKNLDHLACSEIRAANLCHCSFISAWLRGFASPFNIKETHQNCVKDKAMKSIIAIRNVTEDVAREAISRVFQKCYNDLEPIGRRIRRNSLDMKKAYDEGPLYGYAT